MAWENLNARLASALVPGLIGTGPAWRSIGHEYHDQDPIVVDHDGGSGGVLNRSRGESSIW